MSLWEEHELCNLSLLTSENAGSDDAFQHKIVKNDSASHWKALVLHRHLTETLSRWSVAQSIAAAFGAGGTIKGPPPRSNLEIIFESMIATCSALPGNLLYIFATSAFNINGYIAYFRWERLVKHFPDHASPWFGMIPQIGPSDPRKMKGWISNNCTPDGPMKYKLNHRVHSSVVRAADCRSAGPWFKSGCALDTEYTAGGKGCKSQTHAKGKRNHDYANRNEKHNQTTRPKYETCWQRPWEQEERESNAPESSNTKPETQL